MTRHRSPSTFVIPLVTAGRKASDAPGYSLLSASLSKLVAPGYADDGDCHLSVVIDNSGNADINRLLVKLNGSEIWYANLTIAKGALYSTLSNGFHSMGDSGGPAAFFAWPNLGVGHACSFFLGAQFAEGQTENDTTILFITPFYPGTFNLP